MLEHADATDGAVVAAQYYKKSNTIRFGIADTGLGIRATINRSYNTQDDLDAIKLALTPGVTGTTKREGGTEFNAGAGLFFIKSIAKINRSLFLIYSGNAMYKLLKGAASKKRNALYADPGLDEHSEKTTLPAWQGTIVGVDIDLDSTNEFNALLDIIRTTYSQAVRERKRARYKNARFI